jgi:hypothetical protein
VHCQGQTPFSEEETKEGTEKRNNWLRVIQQGRGLTPGKQCRPLGLWTSVPLIASRILRLLLLLWPVSFFSYFKKFVENTKECSTFLKALFKAGF